MKIKNEYGQALLFVVVAVTIALAVGVSISTRTLNSQKRVSSSDTSIRIANAAEGGVEIALGKTYTFLSNLSKLSATASSTDDINCTDDGFTSRDGASCVMTYSSSPGDNITTKAAVSAKTFGLNSPDNYWFDLNPGTVKEIYLNGYTDSGWSGSSHGIYVCWENPNTAIYTLSYNASGNIKKEWFISNTFGETSDTSGFTTTSFKNGHSEYTGCGSVHLVSSPYGLRIRALYDTTRVHVYPGTNGTFPPQGYAITSVGQLTSGDTTETRVVVVYKSFPYASSMVDYGFYSTAGVMN